MAIAPVPSAAATPARSLSSRNTRARTENRMASRPSEIAVTDAAVWLVDFKTGRPPRDGAPAPRGQAAQVALYARLLATIYPDRPVIPLLVWTAGPVVRRLTPEDCAAALHTLA